MKSNQTQLLHRGLLDTNIVNEYLNLSKEDLLLKLKDAPQYRSASIHVLTLKYYLDKDYTSILLEQLTKEKALYTKIEIQNSLTAHGDIIQMCQYLGCIGNNQYKEIPIKCSLKKSYPLARDIIARSLSYIDINKFDIFFSSLKVLPYPQLLEGIDALGFLCFYNSQVKHINVYTFIQDCLIQYQDDLLITWKLITCLSAFPQSYPLLQQLKQTKKHPILIKEVERSLQIIYSNNNHSN